MRANGGGVRAGRRCLSGLYGDRGSCGAGGAPARGRARSTPTSGRGAGPRRRGIARRLEVAGCRPRRCATSSRSSRRNRAAFQVDSERVWAAAVRGGGAGCVVGAPPEAVVSVAAFTDARAAGPSPSIGSKRVPGVPAHDLFAALSGRWSRGVGRWSRGRTNRSPPRRGWRRPTSTSLSGARAGARRRTSLAPGLPPSARALARRDGHQPARRADGDARHHRLDGASAVVPRGGLHRVARCRAGVVRALVG